MIGPGTVIGQGTVLQREIGRGGVGVVWLAIRHGQQVAVKLLDATAHTSNDAWARFDREASASARIESPHVVRVIEAGRLPDGQPFLVMELLHGCDLREHLRRAGMLAPALTATIVQQICDALQRAHTLGIVHRDLKPANVFVVDGPQPFVKVLDFGIAKVLDDQGLGLTATGALLGTPHYMSPEQFVSPRGVDLRSDLWSLAVVAYECSTGRLPFGGETVGALAIAVHKPFPPPSQLVRSLPATLDAWFVRALAPDRERRFQSAHELAATFLEAVQGRAPAAGAMAASKPTLASATGGAPPMAATRSKRGWLVAAGAIAAVALGTAGFLVHRARSPSTTASAKAEAARGASCEALRKQSAFDRKTDEAGIAACDALCSRGEQAACVALGRALSEASRDRDDGRALAALQRACQGDEARGCAEAGLLLARGRGGQRDKAGAVALYRRGCDAGDRGACSHLARAHVTGAGVQRDPARAVALYQQGCDAGTVADCSALGLQYAVGQGVPQDDVRAAALLKQACDGGAWIGCANLAIAYEQGRGVRQDHRLAGELVKKACDHDSVLGCAMQRELTMGDRSPEADARAVALFTASCELGDARACRFLGWWHEAGAAIAQDDKRAAELFESACDGDEPDACVNAGQMYERGRGVPQDLPRALALFKRACDDGRGMGCENLAQAYQGGHGVPQDLAKAASLYRTACDLGLGVACTNLAGLHLQGLGVPKDEAVANELWTRGCALGTAQACEAAAYNHLVGRGVIRDESVAARQFAAACDRGFLKSCAWLGHLYRAGRGVPKDAARADAMYKKACGGGDAEACTEAGQSR